MPRILNKKNIIIIVFLILALDFSDFFLNFFKLYKYDYTQRMIAVYGNCGQESYGFINKINKKYKLKKNILILHPNPNISFNNSNWFIHKIKKKYYDNQIILINENNNLKKINSKKYILSFKEKNLGQYEVIEKESNCYYLKKYD